MICGHGGRKERVLVEVMPDSPLQTIVNQPVVTSRTRILFARSGTSDVVVVTGGAGDVPVATGDGVPLPPSKGADGDLELPGDPGRTGAGLHQSQCSDFDGVASLRSSSSRGSILAHD